MCFCNKKTGFDKFFTCDCGGTFCQIHRYTHTHNCKCINDKKKKQKKLLEKSNPKMEIIYIGKSLTFIYIIEFI